MIRRPQAWRHALDPRDPEYSEPPEVDECDDEPPEAHDALPETGRYDPRFDGPYHYIPPGE